MTQPQSSDLFTRVKIPSEKKKIFKELLESKAELLVKGKAEGLYRLRANMMADGRWLACSFQAGSDAANPDSADDLHIVNFSVGPERYFFQCQVQISNESVLLETDVDLFHLQRRKTMRIPLPEELQATANIINHQDRSCLVTCKMLDFSAGGIRLVDPVPALPYRMNDQCILIIRLGTRKPFEMTGLIRHLMPNSDSQPGVIFGVEFVDKNHLMDNKLMSLQMDLQAEIFRKWKRHQW